ncbi:uncharacterized protein PHACADRAFT_144419 [Phanerochaete carnosa HHB-10118-sp]|uniref:L-serine ammonia-lyase n=1 Tax=Phanerochaete carnosa (strain HHB-10118-sp) TaxID=650164 RepID=K5WYY9_PHACS|nr:uncharacterized protein PHACADRAFT_144419 [Phanerochaete carnosa HHB-10118-sp]EKM55717.1 hypothetical protein PHACADRAFT_144419 [Phanerochaete carnosa HHB-10118-sp]
MATSKPLYLDTPLVYSKHISHALGANVYLKLDSYKYRGISRFVQKALEEHGPHVHLVAASGGNAGLAAACAGKALGLRCTIFLPEGASASTLDFLKMEGAEVVERGSCYQHALDAAIELVRSSKDAVMVPAYDEPLLWDGHASMVAECAAQLPAGVARPDAVVCCVGGGGLAGGVMLGCARAGWDAVPLVAVETHGSSCFYQSLALNAGSAFPGAPLPPRAGTEALHDAAHDVRYARLATLTSKATSLGASWPSPGVVKMALERAGGVRSVCVSDEMAMEVAVRFADEHKIMAELACAATLAPAYYKELFDKLVPPKPNGEPRNVIFIVCGGFKVSVAELMEYAKTAAGDKAPDWEVLCNGERWSILKQ